MTYQHQVDGGRPPLCVWEHGIHIGLAQHLLVEAQGDGQRVWHHQDKDPDPADAVSQCVESALPHGVHHLQGSPMGVASADAGSSREELQFAGSRPAWAWQQHKSVQSAHSWLASSSRR